MTEIPKDLEEVERHLRVIQSSAQCSLSGTPGGNLAQPHRTLRRILARVIKIRKALNLEPLER